MRKLIWAINATIDGFTDHTALIADDELHNFHADLLGTVDIILFGRKTYQLMESYWPNAPEDPKATKSTIRFADRINGMSKILFSKTLNKVTWNNTKLIKENITDEVLKLKEQPGNGISIGSISIASHFMKPGMIDEYWFLVQPVILGRGKHLVEGIQDRHNLELLDTKSLKSGIVVLHYQAND